MNAKEFFKAYHGVGRMEYFPAEAPGLMLPVLLASNGITDILKLSTLEGMIAFLLLYISGFLVNSMTDIEVDMKYKTRVSGSVAALGRENLRNLLIIHVVLATILSVHIAYLVDNPLVIVLLGVGLFFGMGYSLKPFQFKVGGVMHPVSFMISLFFIPALFLYMCVNGELPGVGGFFVFGGFTVMHYAIALTNQTGDFLEDRDTGLTTPAVRWGVTRTLRMALTFTLVGLVIVTVGLYWLFYNLEIGNTTLLLVIVIIPVVLLAGYQVPIRGMTDQIKLSLISDGELGRNPETKRMDRIKERMNYPMWQAAGIYSLFAMVLMVFLISNMG